MISTRAGGPARLSSKMSSTQKKISNSKKTVKTISMNDSSTRVFSSFSKGRVALEPQAGQGGLPLFFGKQYPCSQNLAEFGKEFLAVAAFALFAENIHARVQQVEQVQEVGFRSFWNLG